jgi:hypothetical protein
MELISLVDTCPATEICDVLDKYLKNVPHDCDGVTMSGIDLDGALNLASIERCQAEWSMWGVMRRRSTSADASIPSPRRRDQAARTVAVGRFTR